MIQTNPPIYLYMVFIIIIHNNYSLSENQQIKDTLLIELSILTICQF